MAPVRSSSPRLGVQLPLQLRHMHSGFVMRIHHGDRRRGDRVAGRARRHLKLNPSSLAAMAAMAAAPGTASNGCPPRQLAVQLQAAWKAPSHLQLRRHWHWRRWTRTRTPLPVALAAPVGAGPLARSLKGHAPFLGPSPLALAGPGCSRNSDSELEEPESFSTADCPTLNQPCPEHALDLDLHLELEPDSEAQVEAALHGAPTPTPSRLGRELNSKVWAVTAAAVLR